MLGPGPPALARCAGAGRARLLADRRALSQVLVRVLGNAARHSAPEDWIEVGLQARGDRLELTIDDEGNGLCAPDRAAQPGRAGQPRDSVSAWRWHGR